MPSRGVEGPWPAVGTYVGVTVERNALNDGRRKISCLLEDASGVLHEAVVGLEKDKRHPLPPESTPMFFRKTSAMRDSPSLPQSDGAWGVLRWLGGMIAGRTVVSPSECPSVRIRGEPGRERADAPGACWPGCEGATVSLHPDDENEIKTKSAYQWLRTVPTSDSLDWLHSASARLSMFASTSCPSDALADECLALLRQLLCLPLSLHDVSAIGLTEALGRIAHVHCNNGQSTQAGVASLATNLLQQLQSSFACHTTSLLRAEANALMFSSYSSYATTHEQQQQQHIALEQPLQGGSMPQTPLTPGVAHPQVIGSHSMLRTPASHGQTPQSFDKPPASTAPSARSVSADALLQPQPSSALPEKRGDMYAEGLHDTNAVTDYKKARECNMGDRRFESEDSENKLQPENGHAEQNPGNPERQGTETPGETSQKEQNQNEQAIIDHGTNDYATGHTKDASIHDVQEKDATDESCGTDA